MGIQKLVGTKKMSEKKIGVKNFLIRKILFKFLSKLWANKNHNTFDEGQIIFKITQFQGSQENAVSYISQMRLMVPSLKLHHIII